MKLVYYLFFIILFSCNIIEDKTDTEFTKEIATAKKGWGKDTLRLQTMYGFKLRMSKEEYEKHYDSLIKVGITSSTVMDRLSSFAKDVTCASAIPQGMILE